MKKNFIKSSLTFIFTICLLASLIGLVLVNGKTFNAFADSTAWKTGVFEMDDGVSLKLSDTTNGMRFILRMDENVYNCIKNNNDFEVGFVISTKEHMLSANGDYSDLKQVGGAIDKEKIYKDGDYYLANGCITNIYQSNFKRNFVAIGYIKRGEDVRYTEYNDLARNNLYDTVNMAVLNGYAEKVFSCDTYVGTPDPTDDNTGWYGSADYPIVVENSTDYDKIVDIANENDLSQYTVLVKENVETNKVIVSETKPSIIVESVYEVNTLIEALPDSVTMPDGIGVIGRIRDVEKKYNALSDGNKGQVDNYAKVESLLASIEGYDRVYKNDADDGTVIPSYVPNYTSTVGGTATTRQDDVYGNVLTVKSDEGGKAALSFTNFPSIEKYAKIYFYVKVSVACDIYLSDGTTNDGWGVDYKNTWSTSGFWCNADNWRLIEVDTSSGYINGNFALGFRTNTTGFTFEISDFYGVLKTGEKIGLTFGNFTDSGTTNEYGTVYNFTQGWSSTTDLGAFNKNALSNALVSGHDSLYFWIYNPNDTAVDFKFAGDMNEWNPTGDYVTNLASKKWTKVVITPEIVRQGNNGTWFVNVTSGAGTAGWQISPIYSFLSDVSYTDYADVKDVIALINAIPETVTLNDKATVESVRTAYNKLTAEQQGLIVNISKLTSAETTIENIESANEVIALIDSINARDIDEALVKEARNEYNALADNAKAYVTNLTTLEEYETEIAERNNLQSAVNNVITLIENLPDSVIMPDHLVFVSRIEAAENKYNALSDEGKEQITNYAKLRTLVNAIKGYDTVHVQTVNSVDVVPSHVPNYTSTIGGTASMGYDGYYGNYLKVTPNAGGKVAIQYKNFPDVSKYENIYFNIRVVGASCDIYLSDGITNDGWGTNWHNTWSMSGFWANDGNWIQKEVAVSTGIFSTNWALGLRTNTTGVSFEITDIVGYAPDLGTNSGLTFGSFTDSGTINAYGTVYNFTQGWSSATDLGAFNQNALSNALASDDDSLHFYIYNPNDTAVDFSFSGEMNDWNPTGDYVTNLASKKWTRVVITPEIVRQGNNGTWFVNVTSGAGTAGWQISPIYSFSSGDAVDKLQNRINALNTENPDATQVQLAREEYENLTETQKDIVDITNLIACETNLYGDVENAPFITNGTSQYKIYYDTGLDTYATFMQEQINSATGVTLSINKNISQNEDEYRYAIVLGYNELATALRVECPSDGYVIKRVGRVVFILADRNDDYRMATLKFLNEVIGYDMISEDCVVYDASKAETLPSFDVTGNPFDYRQKQTYMTEDELFGMGLSSNTDLWVHSSEGWDMHNTLHYLPTKTYQSAHPSWYYTYTDSTNTLRTQICPTAGGSSAEFNAMVGAIAANMLVQINEQSEKENISFSIMDTGDGDDCQCTRCKLYDTLYGEGGFAAAWVDLMNAVNAKIRESLPADKVLNIAFLAYRGTEKAPANIDANGNVTLLKRYEIRDDGTYTLTNVDLRCDKGVTVWLAPINGKYAENLNHADNAETLKTIKKWCAISDSVYLWMYGTNFKFYMYPYNTWQASAENYKILADLGSVKAVWSQSNETEATAFSDLKGYIDSKFMADANADYETVLDNYFTNYYGAGATKMREMFDKIVARCEEIEADYDGLGRGIYDEIGNTSGFLGMGGTKYWEKSWLESLVTLCDEAKAAVDADTSLTEAQKTAIKNRITKESLFPRYVLCTSFASSYSASKKKSMRQAFKADANALGLTLYREADGLLTDLYDDWGV